MLRQCCLFRKYLYLGSDSFRMDLWGQKCCLKTCPLFGRFKWELDTLYVCHVDLCICLMSFFYKKMYNNKVLLNMSEILLFNPSSGSQGRNLFATSQIASSSFWDMYCTHRDSCSFPFVSYFSTLSNSSRSQSCLMSFFAKNLPHVVWTKTGSLFDNLGNSAVSFEELQRGIPRICGPSRHAECYCQRFRRWEEEHLG